MMAAIKKLDPLNIREVADWVAQTSKLRLLVFHHSSKTRSGYLYAYSLTKPDPELEYDVHKQGGVLVGYYTRKAEPAQIMADIASAMVGA